MAAIITKDNRLNNTRQFVESVSEVANTNIYLFIGKPEAWTNDISPDTPVDTYRTQVDVWDSMIALKKVTSGDITHVIPRNNWTSGNTYARYDDATPSSNLFASKYVVLNSAYNVYKCLYNSNSTVSSTPSTVEPTGTGGAANNLIYTSDGYVWKYMYNIDTLNWTKFNTTTFIPIVSSAAVTTNAANTKGIYAYRIVSANTNAAISSQLLTVVGDGTGANASVVITSGNVATVVVNNPGSNYTVANITTNLGNAVIEPVITPPDGHGYDAIDELGGLYAMINVRLEQSDADFPVSGAKFRQVGLIKDPWNFGTTTLSTASTLKAYSNVTLASVSNPGSLVAGATLTGATSGANATLVAYSGTNLYYVKSRNSSSNLIANFRSFTNGETIRVGGTTIGTISGFGNATVSLNSGELIYIDNRNVISRASDQVESLYVVLQF